MVSPWGLRVTSPTSKQGLKTKVILSIPSQRKAVQVYNPFPQNNPPGSLSSITRSKAVYPFFARRVTSAPWFSRYLTISLFLERKEKARVRRTESESLALLLGKTLMVLTTGRHL